jgi:hypothetical protein
MRRRWLIVGGGVVWAIMGLVLLWRTAREGEGGEGLSGVTEAWPLEQRQQPPSAGYPGDEILRGYGADGGSAQQDLRLLAEVLGNFALLLKGPDSLPLGANEELAAALRGKNRAGLVFLSGDAEVLNERGQLVDRWGTPLFFHARDRQRIDLRSAGPDQEMWTADDVHRLHDGQFLRGEALNAPSLFEASGGRGELR